MKILLVNPDLTAEDIGHYSSGVEKARGRYPSLGLLYIAAVLEGEGHAVRVFDSEVEPAERLARTLKEFAPEIVGIHVMTWTFRQAGRIAALAKDILPSAVVMAGGAGVTSSPDACMRHALFDYGVVGEGEETVKELVKAIEEGRDGAGVAGVVSRRVPSTKRPLINDLDSIPLPARHLVPMGHYYDVFTIRRNFATIVTSRGCPYRCIYCDRTNRMGTKWRTFSNRRIIEEMKEIKGRYNIGEVMFFDDEFIIDRRKTMGLCEMILEEGLDVIWECRARVDVVDTELLKVMRRAGCYRIRYGFEAGDDGILKALKKGITVKQSLECGRMTKEAGIEIFGYFMMGSPGETKETLKKTLSLAFEIDPDFAIFSKTILIPGSELFDWGVSEGLIEGDYWERFFSGEPLNTAPAVSTDALPESEVGAFLKKANREFYMRPNFIARRLSKLRSLSQLKRQATMAHSLLCK